MARWNGNYIENPEAYGRAVTRSIHARATAKRRKAWDAANPVLSAWLNWTGYTETAEEGAARQAAFDRGEDVPSPKFERHAAGFVPTFARDGYNKWGSLSPKATELLQKIYNERTEKDEARKAQWAAEKATAQPWTAGRQVVEGVVVSIKWVEGFARHYGAAPPQVKKIIIKRADGSRVYASAGTGALSAAEKGDTVRVTLTIEPKAEEPTFAFGSRPAKGEILQTAAPAAEEAK